MTDTQIFTLAVSIAVPVAALLVGSSRLTDIRVALTGSVSETKDTLRAETKAATAEIRTEIALLRGEMNAGFKSIERKLDDILEAHGDHETRLQKLEAKS